MAASGVSPGLIYGIGYVGKNPGLLPGLAEGEGKSVLRMGLSGPTRRSRRPRGPGDAAGGGLSRSPRCAPAAKPQRDVRDRAAVTPPVPRRAGSHEKAGRRAGTGVPGGVPRTELSKRPCQNAAQRARRPRTRRGTGSD